MPERPSSSDPSSSARPASGAVARGPLAVEGGRKLDVSAIETWLFDLDNTLYPATSGIFDQVDRRMGLYIEGLLGLEREEARAVQKRYFREHGTTMRGLMTHHAVDPHEFMDFVHAIDLTVLEPDAALDRVLGRLPGRKLIFTNASTAHAERVLERLGVAGHFEAIFDIGHAGFEPKPASRPYELIVERHGLEPARTVFVEDSERNLEPAAAMGMTTVWVASDTHWAGDGAAAHIHYAIEDLAGWLAGLLPDEEG